MRTWRAGVLVNIAILAACGGNQVRKPWPAELIVYDRAINVRHTERRNGTHEVSYQMRAVYPADSVVLAIHSALPAVRWQPLTEDWLNPGNPSGNSRGWSTFTDGTKRPNTFVHIWWSQWKDDVGNLIEYALRYDSSLPPEEYREKPDSEVLNVTAWFFPAAVVNATRKQAGIVGPLK
jgi:hypothetical protein